MVRMQHPALMRYAFAAVSVGLFTWFEAATWPLFRGAAPLPLIAGVVIAAALAGPGPGIFATLVGVAAMHALPAGAFPEAGPEAFAALAAFVGTGVASSVLCLSPHLGRARIRRMLEGVHDGCAFLGPDRKWRFVNRAAAESAGRTPDDLVGKNVSDVFPHLGDRGALREVNRAMDEGVPGRLETWHEPRARWYETHLYPTPEGVMVIVRDVTERRRSEEALRDSERRERQARAEAESANRSKDEFLAVLSHELRTPLTAITGWLRLMRLGALDAPGASRALEAVERNADILVRLVEDLLDASRIVSGQLKMEARPVPLGGVIRAALDAIGPAAEAKHIRVDSRLGPDEDLVLGDSERLQQVFWNLLSNAVKHTPPEGTIEVTSGRRNGMLSATVTDSGPGIPPEMLPRIFERFHQADSTQNRRHSGLGLGLAIVRHLVELHGGSVAARSGGTGARFTVLLPALAPAEGAPRLPQEPPVAASREKGSASEIPSLQGVRVLLVDDEEDTRAVLTRMLRWRRADVTACGSAAEARAALASRRPDVLVSDIGMPGESGYSLIESVRASERGTGLRLPAIALSAYAQDAHRIHAAASGYDAHVAKPVEPDALIRAVAAVRRGPIAATR